MKKNDEVKRIANALVGCRNMTRWNSASIFELYYNGIYTLLSDVAKLDVFAAKIASEIYERAESYAKSVKKQVMPLVSAKQAWCIAYAAVENNIEVLF